MNGNFGTRVFAVIGQIIAQFAVEFDLAFLDKLHDQDGGKLFCDRTDTEFRLRGNRHVVCHIRQSETLVEQNLIAARYQHANSWSVLRTGLPKDQTGELLRVGHFQRGIGARMLVGAHDQRLAFSLRHRDGNDLRIKKTALCCGSRFIPEAGPADPGLEINLNLLTETWALLKLTRQRRDLFLVIIGISWFWLFGAVLLTQIAPLSKDYLLADDNVATLLLAIISIGIGAGSILCAHLSKGEISARFVPFGAIGMAVFTIDLYFASGAAATGTAATLLDIPRFLDAPENWRICADVALVAMFGGIFTVPLYTLMQHRADPAQRSRVIAGNNVLNALFMVVGSLAATIMLAFDFTIPQVFLAMACATVVVVV